MTHEQRVHPRHTALTETQTCRRCGTVQVSRVARCVQPMVLHVQSQPRHRRCWFSMRLDPVPATVRFGGGAERTGPRIQMHLQQARLARPCFCKVAGLPEQHSTQKHALPAIRRNMATAVISPGAPPDGICWIREVRVCTRAYAHCRHVGAPAASPWGVTRSRLGRRWPGHLTACARWIVAWTHRPVHAG